MEPLLKLREVASCLGVSVSTVERLIADDAFRGGVVRFRGNTRITARALSSFIACHTDDPAAAEKDFAPMAVRSKERPTFAAVTTQTNAPRERRVKHFETTVSDALARQKQDAT